MQLQSLLLRQQHIHGGGSRYVIRKEKAAMRRRTSRILAAVLTMVMLVCQASLTVRDAAGTGNLMSFGEDTGLSVEGGGAAENIPGGVFRY